MAIISRFERLGQKIGQKIPIRPLALTAIIGLAIIAWFGLATYRLAFDQPLPPEKLSSHRLQVNTSQYFTLQTAIDFYQAPTAAGTVRSDLFGPVPK